MDISLGKKNFDTGVNKLFEYYKIKIASYFSLRRLAYVDPDEQLEIDGIVGIFKKAKRRHAGFINKRLIRSSHQQYFSNPVRICLGCP